ncbi:hypothetical protein [Natronomonas sp.]|uniref:hypothetical protein n=1 Tax=Natronomonas sp. TaxID=2184060 RepID=UPI002FC37642
MTSLSCGIASNTSTSMTNANRTDSLTAAAEPSRVPPTSPSNSAIARWRSCWRLLAPEPNHTTTV